MKNKLKKAFNLSDEAISIIEALIPLDDFKIALEEDELFPNTKRNIVIEKGFITDNDYAYAIFHLGSDSTLEIMAAYADQNISFMKKFMVLLVLIMIIELFLVDTLMLMELKEKFWVNKIMMVLLTMGKINIIKLLIKMNF